MTEMRGIHFPTLCDNPEFVAGLFRELAAQRYNAADKARFDELRREGIAALEREDLNPLRQMIIRLCEYEIGLGAGNVKFEALASIIRA